MSILFPGEYHGGGLAGFAGDPRDMGLPAPDGTSAGLPYWIRQADAIGTALTFLAIPASCIASHLVNVADPGDAPVADPSQAGQTNYSYGGNN